MVNKKKEAILIVDDQSSWRELLVELLEDDYEVISRESYPEAKKALLNQDPPFHVVIVDIRLEDTDQANEEGLSLVEEINSLGEYTNSIVITGYPTVQTTKKAFRDLAVFDYLEKYSGEGRIFDHGAFRTVVQQAVDDAEKKRLNLLVQGDNHVLDN